MIQMIHWNCDHFRKCRRRYHYSIYSTTHRACFKQTCGILKRLSGHCLSNVRPFAFFVCQYPIIDVPFDIANHSTSVSPPASDVLRKFRTFRNCNRKLPFKLCCIQLFELHTAGIVRNFTEIFGWVKSPDKYVYNIHCHKLSWF
jgi:hypothetical protein